MTSFADFLGAYGIPTAMAVGTMLPGPLSSAKRISQLFPKLAKNPTGYGYLLTRNLYEGMAFGLGRTLDEVQHAFTVISAERISFVHDEPLTKNLSNIHSSLRSPHALVYIS